MQFRCWRRGRVRRECWPVANRSGRCSICDWHSLGCWCRWIGCPNSPVSTADADAVTIGACVTHATIADGMVPDIGGNVLARVADGIAYRAVRNRGTIGGSLCHADPAADWVTVLIALDAVAELHGPGGVRHLPVAEFVQGAFRTALGPGEILRAVRVPRLPLNARWGYVKACRKPGDFAHAMTALMLATRTRRVVIGALGGKPLLLEGDTASIDGATRALQAMDDVDEVQRRMQFATLRRALAEADP